MRPGRARQPAFTLLEVLVSLGIFALAAVVLGAAYVNVLVNYHTMQHRGALRSEAALVRTLLLAEPDRARVERGGEVPLADGGSLRWRARLADTPVADLFEVELELEITGGGAGLPRRERETFLVLRPTWSDPDKREQLRAAARTRLAKRSS